MQMHFQATPASPRIPATCLKVPLLHLSMENSCMYSWQKKIKYGSQLVTFKTTAQRVLRNSSS